MNRRKENAAVIGVGAAACVACCAGPIMGVLAAIGIGTVAGVLLVGIAGLLVGAIVIAVFTVRRTSRNTTCAASPEVVPVEMPTLKGR